MRNPAPHHGLVDRAREAPQTIVAYSCLLLVILFAFQSLYPALFRTWYFSSDEYVFAAEVIRFSNLDFRQQFFDIPGTVFMALNTVTWLVVYAVGWTAGLAGSDSIGTFTFQHMSWLFVLMRATTLFFFLLSVVLLFVVAKRIFNTVAAAFASLLLAMSPAYTSYSSFVRTESLAMALMLGAVLMMLRAIDDGESARSSPPRLGDRFLLAGVLAGLAASARLHALTAIVPALILLEWCAARPKFSAYPEWVQRWARWVLPVTWAAGLAAFVLFPSRMTDTPAAVRLLTIAVWGWIAATVLASVLCLVPGGRRIVIRVASPGLIKVALGCAAGLLIGNPTVIPQRRFFFQSIQMYSGYVDMERMFWPFWRNFWWYIKHYAAILAPDPVTFWLLGAGAALILVMRERRALPFLIAAALFFVSKPINLAAPPHHVILWLPFFFLVCAYPVGKVAEIVALHRSGRIPAGIALTLSLWMTFLYLTPGPRVAGSNALVNEARLQNIGRATEWIKQHAGPRDTVAISYFCFNPDTFYTWLRYLEVPVPASALDGRDYVIWWGHASVLVGKTGYACATPGDVDAMKTKLDLSSPGEGTNPYADSHFTRVATFGSRSSQVDLFQFSYK